jgi:rhodanese-related sulfurtransferase
MPTGDRVPFMPKAHLVPLLTALLLGVTLAGCTGPQENPTTGLQELSTWKASLEEAEDPYLLDVRTPEEYQEAHIEGSWLIPYGELDTRADELPEDKDETLWVYCRTDRRSQIALESLEEMGYTDVRVLRGGIIAWHQAGHPLVFGENRPDA